MCDYQSGLMIGYRFQPSPNAPILKAVEQGSLKDWSVYHHAVEYTEVQDGAASHSLFGIAPVAALNSQSASNQIQKVTAYGIDETFLRGVKGQLDALLDAIGQHIGDAEFGVWMYLANFVDEG